MNGSAERSLDEAQAGRAVPRIIVAVPVCNERERIVACLNAFAAQVGLERGSFGIVLFLNNCTDGTAEIVRACIDMPWPIRIIERDDPNASAGWARRIAMNAAADWLGENPSVDNILLTSDADSRVPSDWILRNLSALTAGADAVAGRIALDPEDAAKLPPHLQARGCLESEYERLLTEIDARLDPRSGDPWPCHWTKSGATLAVRLSVYRKVGGMPDMPLGEDHAFIGAVRAKGFIVRHAPEIEVITSGRLDGRATGGVADTMRLRCRAPETPCDIRLEPAGRVAMRAMIRRRIQTLCADHRFASSWLRWLLGVPVETARALDKSNGTDAALAVFEMPSTRLGYRPVTPSQLPGQIRRARVLRRVLQSLMPDIDGASQSKDDLIGIVKPARTPTFQTLDVGVPEVNQAR